MKDDHRRLDPTRFREPVAGGRLALFSLAGDDGMQVAVCNHGAKILQVLLPTADGGMIDVALGHDSGGQTLAGMPSAGAFIGRYANRIAGATLSLDGRAWRLDANDGRHCLHGGDNGSRHRIFDAHQDDPRNLDMHLLFREAEDGFPGDLDLSLSYSLPGNGVLAIDYRAVCLSRPGVACFTSHIFFNLSGHDAGDIADHRFQINADAFLPLDRERVPTGEIRSVAGTPFDFRAGQDYRSFLKRAADDPQLAQFAMPGLDHSFVTDPTDDRGLHFQASAGVAERTLELWSTEPCLHFFDGAAMDGSVPRYGGKQGVRYGRRAGFCFEPQGFPNAPNIPGFPWRLLVPEESFTGRMEFRFGNS